jgi:hypothetical protein
LYRFFYVHSLLPSRRYVQDGEEYFKENVEQMKDAELTTLHVNFEHVVDHSDELVRMFAC